MITLVLDISDAGRNSPGSSAMLSAVSSAAQQNVTAKKAFTFVAYDPGGANYDDAVDMFDAPVLNNQYCTCIYTTKPFVNEQPPVEPPVDTQEFGLLAPIKHPIYVPADNWWNRRVDTAPLDSASAALIASIKSYDHHYVHPDFGSGWGIPYSVADAATPLQPVTFSNTSESDAGYPGGPAGYPIPLAARTDKAHYVEAGGSLEGDRHLLVYDPARKAVYELSYAAWDGAKWKAGYGAVFKIDSNYRRPNGWTSTDAAGLCVLAGLVRYDEVYGDEPILHATRFSLKTVNNHVWPASHTGSSDSGGMPLGLRLRLKASVNLSSYSAPMRKLFESWKVYGLICADRGGNMYIQGTLDDRWSNAVLNPAFHSLDADDFEVVQRGWGAP